MSALSYAHGASDVPLLGETIGENLRRTVARPITVTWKIQKFRMREVAIEELGLEQAADVVTA